MAAGAVEIVGQLLAAALQGVDQALAGCFVGGVGDVAGLRFGSCGEEFFFLELEAFPRRVAEDDVEAAVHEYVAEFERPMEVGVMLRCGDGCADHLAVRCAGEHLADFVRGRDQIGLIGGPRGKGGRRTHTSRRRRPA